MTVAAYDPGLQQVEPYRSRTTADLIEWAQAADAAHRVANMLCVTSFVPEEFRGKPAETAAAILAGNELGFSPISSLNAFHIIKGRAAPNALALRAVCQSAGHEFDLVESTPARAVMKARRRGTDRWQTVTWDIQRAQRLNYLGRKQWIEQPQSMLVARVTSEAARLVGADAIMGIPYSYEELLDMDPVGAVDGAGGSAEGSVPPAPARRRRSTAARPALAPSAAVGASPVTPGPTGRPPLPGEDTAPQAAEPQPTTDQLAEEADTIRAAEEEHADEIVAAMAELIDSTRPEDDEAYDPTEPDPATETAPAPEKAADAPPAKTVNMKRLFALLREADIGDRHEYASGVLKRQVTSYSQLSQADVDELVDNIEAITTDDEPPEETE